MKKVPEYESHPPRKLDKNIENTSDNLSMISHHLNSRSTAKRLKGNIKNKMKEDMLKIFEAPKNKKRIMPVGINDDIKSISKISRSINPFDEDKNNYDPKQRENQQNESLNPSKISNNLDRNIDSIKTVSSINNAINSLNPKELEIKIESSLQLLQLYNQHLKSLNMKNRDLSLNYEINNLKTRIIHLKEEIKELYSVLK